VSTSQNKNLEVWDIAPGAWSKRWRATQSGNVPLARSAMRGRRRFVASAAWEIAQVGRSGASTSFLKIHAF
jgi:hypothetical protein